MQTHQLYKTAFFALAISVLAGCGGGGSSSGGMAANPVVSPVLPIGKFSGTYSNASYSGSIEVTINGPANVVIAMTGIPCLASPFSDGMGAEVSGDFLVIGGAINGAGLTNIETTPVININIPIEGGTGVFDLAPPAPCSSQVDGTITLNR